MASWSEVVAALPELEELAVRLWPGITALHRDEVPPEGQPCFSVSYLATVRRDGAPRLHPFCPILAGGGLFAVIPRRSPKGWDLRRDPRGVIHALPGPDDDELCLRVLADEVTGDPSKRALVTEIVGRSGVGGMLESISEDPLFEFDIGQVDLARWVDVGQPGTHAVRIHWRAP